MWKFVTIFVVVLVADGALGACGLCGSKSNVVCRNQTSFSLCNGDDDVSLHEYNCPPGTICGDDIRICSPNPENPCNPVCGNCTSRFACLSEETYAFCFGLGYPSGAIYICPEGTVCSTQKDSVQACYRKELIENGEIDCYKGVIVNVGNTNGANVLLPPI